MYLWTYTLWYVSFAEVGSVYILFLFCCVYYESRKRELTTKGENWCLLFIVYLLWIDKLQQVRDFYFSDFLTPFKFVFPGSKKKESFQGLLPDSRAEQSRQRARFRRSPGTNRPVVAIPIADQCLFWWCSKLNARATASLCLEGGGGENKRSSRHNVVSIEATRNGPHETVSVCGWCVYVFICATKPLQLITACLLGGMPALNRATYPTNEACPQRIAYGMFKHVFVSAKFCAVLTLRRVNAPETRVWAVVTTSLERTGWVCERWEKLF